MATKKRPQIKGKGADVFFTESEPQEEEEKLQEKVKAEKRVMVTFYLPSSLVDKLDKVWIERRLKDRKVQKSHLVADALQAYLKE